MLGVHSDDTLETILLLTSRPITSTRHAPRLQLVQLRVSIESSLYLNFTQAFGHRYCKLRDLNQSPEIERFRMSGGNHQHPIVDA
ncbi:hypothetical protein PoB_007547400 [Plakobranchus ocellatus]|uniref:Uncharacterized protein n=1 Tax=Plakobranchus ocellatus TaxID=259542 RepID=A0AAV4DXN4_9GAST|nr:hypothetical protein PoB_007547400 [Plakobranchus ocellatus]